jgi:mRNA-degrading endonuclease RelE of RelBE toxin-antitoxin system
VKVEWSPEAAAFAQRFLRDQEGMRAIVAAADALEDDPYPPEGFHAGGYHRLRVGPYRVMYRVTAT